MAKRKIKSFDLLEFYSFCTVNNKVKPSKKDKFVKIIEFAIKSRMAVLLNAWKCHHAKIKKLRSKPIHRLKRNAFEAFASFSARQYRIRMFVKERDR
jgi:hypothetical protein